jgi:hypothetical protein
MFNNIKMKISTGAKMYRSGWRNWLMFTVLKKCNRQIINSNGSYKIPCPKHPFTFYHKNPPVRTSLLSSTEGFSGALPVDILPVHEELPFSIPENEQANTEKCLVNREGTTFLRPPITVFGKYHGILKFAIYSRYIRDKFATNSQLCEYIVNI